MANESEILHLMVRGRVQGVGFRQYTVRLAHRLGLTGWTRNLPSGEVEVLARVPPSLKGRLLEGLRQGPPLSIVEAVMEMPVPPDASLPESGFHIRH